MNGCMHGAFLGECCAECQVVCRVVLVDATISALNRAHITAEVTRSERTLDSLSGWQVCFKNSSE